VKIPLRSILQGLLGCLLAIGATQARAHSPSASYLYLQPSQNRVEMTWYVSLLDLNELITLDADNDGTITWGEVRMHAEAIRRLLTMKVLLHQGTDTCVPHLEEDLKIDGFQGEQFAVSYGSAICPHPVSAFRVTYTFLFERNKTHRAIIVLNSHGDSTALVATPDQPTLDLAFEGGDSYASFRNFVVHGMHHIWDGLDHILFLVTLILAVLLPHPKMHRGDEAFRRRVWNLTKLTSVFTVAHSITLCLVAVGTIAISPRFFESGIAASIVVMAVNNLRPLFTARYEAVVVFAFGLLHGMGFASMLKQLPLPPAHWLSSLFGFNLGVEIGQLSILFLTAPVVALVGLSLPARAILVRAGGVAIAVAGGIWFVERTFDVTIGG
jgi:hypothetical protein